MKRLAFLFLLAALTNHGIILCESTATALPAPQQSGGKQTAGSRAYAASCAGCHGLDAKGGERAPDIATRPKVRQLSDAAILKILQNGVPNTSMPAFRFLDKATQNSIVAHLRDLQGLGKSINLPGEASRGKQVFFAKGGCAACHMVQGEGGFYASDLTDYARGRSSDAIRAAIVFPNRELDPRRRTVVATLPTGETLTGLARNEDNFSLQLLTPDGKLHLLYKASLKNLSYREESPMPADYGTRLSSAELDDLVRFLASVAETQSIHSRKDDSEDN